MEENLLQISDIYNTFDLEEIKRILENQILSEESEYNNDRPNDYYKPLYVYYCNIFNDNTIDEDVKRNITERFYEVCKLFIDILSKKYEFIIDNDWIEENICNLKPISLALYSFFIIDYKAIVTQIILNYINKHYKDIYSMFDSLRSKKDASTLTNKKKLPMEFSVIVSNIHIISEWILDIIEDNEELFEYIDRDYIFYPIIKKMIDEGYIRGRIYYNFSKVFKKSLTLKGEIALDVISLINRKFENNELEARNNED